MSKMIDISGQRFGKLLVIRAVDERSNAGKMKFLCRCDCGNEKIIVGGSLRSGNTNSCGCWKAKGASERLKKHGFSRHPSYGRYCQMMSRCYNKDHPEYKNYGARGISVCERWRNSVEDFINDIGTAPSRSYSIDRIDNNSNYSPENFRWATKKEQSVNRRVVTILEHDGVAMCAADWARRLGMEKKAVLDRIKDGWPVPIALTTPAIKKGMHKRGESWQLSNGIKKKRIV